MAPIPRLQPYRGPALFSYGFRPFFLFGAIYAGLAVLVWMPAFTGELALLTAFAPRDWHAHEMLFGYVPAVVTGFLLTAIPNWTGRLPLQGRPLITLLLVWVAGRLAVTLSAVIGWLPAAGIDGAFLILVAAAAAREIIAGNNWRNLKVVTVVVLLAAGNIAFHLEAHFAGTAEYATRLGLSAVIILITLIGGRIVPSFTRNWLARANPGRLPAPFGRFDMITVATSAAALLSWVVFPSSRATGLVLILHLGYAFGPLGLLLTGLAAFDVVPVAAGIHAFAGGAIGTMTLAVMTRASLGHTGHALVASRATQAIYLAVLLATLLRICAAIEPAHMMVLIGGAGLLWAAAFLGFGAAYGPLLVRSAQRG